MNARTRAVFDCNVLLQAMASPRGASGECVQRVFDAEVELVLSPIVIKELRGVAARPKVVRKLRLANHSTENFIHAIESCGIFVTDVVKNFVYPRDQSGCPLRGLGDSGYGNRHRYSGSRSFRLDGSIPARWTGVSKTISST